ncbi:MAG: type I-E CRISPR-associated protein Cas7/Cse4/CasC [Myxococcota bacterium]
MSIFVELHALRAFPPSNLNRDDLGTPKTAIFGGARRLRISSQCLKRTWRTSEHFRGAFAEEQLGIRTDRLPQQVLSAVGPTLDDRAREGLLALLASIGKKSGTTSRGYDEGDETGSEDEAEIAQEPRTAHLLFLSRQEIEVVASFVKENADALAKVIAKKKPNVDAIKILRAKLEDYLRRHTSKNAVDVGLFGRFVTSDEFDTIDAALQVAHGLGTQRIEIEYDYFTAVDDLNSDAGASHLGETEFASSVLYLYACCDLAQLEANLGARTVNGRAPDAEARALARRSLPALVRAVAEATPKGKKTGTAPHTPAEYVEVVVRRGAPVSFANAFSKPVGLQEHGGDAMAASIARLSNHRNRIESAYGRDRDVIARLVLRLRDVDGFEPKGCEVVSIDDLAASLERELDARSAQSNA